VHEPPPSLAHPLRCVVLLHESPAGAHHDLLLERRPGCCAAAADPDDRRLIAFRVDPPPHDRSTTLAECLRLPDHRALYLDHEGRLSAARGHVRRLATGTIVSFAESDRSLTAHVAFPNGRVSIHADRLDANRWRLRFDWGSVS